MLEDDGGESGYGFHGVAALRHGCVADVDFPVAGYGSPSSWYAQAAFRTRFRLAPPGCYADVWIHLERFSFLVESLYGDHPAGNADLRPGYSYAVLLRRGHGSDHLFGQFSEYIVIQFFDCQLFAMFPQYYGVCLRLHGQHAHCFSLAENDFPFFAAPSFPGAGNGRCRYCNDCCCGCRRQYDILHFLDIMITWRRYYNSGYLRHISGIVCRFWK